MDEDVIMEDANINHKQRKAQEIKEKLPFVEKYRPSNLNEVISHKEIIGTIKTFMSKHSIPHMLFHGPAGTGKTSCIYALAKELYGDTFKSMVLEMNASDDRGIGTIRDQIKNFCSATSLSSIFVTKTDKKNNEDTFKLVILDEADMMTSAAQASLRRLMEKYTQNCRFCIICNNINKIIPAVISRCMRFRFCPLKTEEALQRLKEILSVEGIRYDSDETLLKAIEIGKGDMRKILNLLESTYMSYNEINKNYLYASAGLPSDEELKQIYKICQQKNLAFNDVYDKIVDMQTNGGFSLSDLIEAVCKSLRYQTNISQTQLLESYILLGKLDYAENKNSNKKIILSNLICLLRRLN